MQEVNCPICSRTSFKKVLYKEGYRIVKCRCGTWYVNPRDDFSKLKEGYNENKISSMFDYQNTYEDDKIDFEIRLKKVLVWINSLGKNIKRKLRLLDVGCNIGGFVEVAEKYGIDAKGIDVNKSAIEFGRKKGLDLECKTIHDVKEKFDIIIMNDLIEHVPEPIKEIKKAKELLSADGFLFISTPNTESLAFKIFKSKWLHLKPKQHIQYFNRDIMRGLMNRYGFGVWEEWNTSRHRSIKVITEKISSYSKIIGGIFRFVLYPIRNISIPINSFDELGIIGKKISKKDLKVVIHGK